MLNKVNEMIKTHKEAIKETTKKPYKNNRILITLDTKRKDCVIYINKNNTVDCWLHDKELNKLYYYNDILEFESAMF